MKLIAIVSIVASSVAGVAGVHAENVKPPQTLVKFADLDVTRIEGEAVLYHRLQIAAKSVCAALDPSLSAAPAALKAAYGKCLASAMAGAVSAIDKPAFTAYVSNVTQPAPSRLASR